MAQDRLGVGFEAWRGDARRLVAQGVRPDAVEWSDDGRPSAPGDGVPVGTVPRRRPALALPPSVLAATRRAACHSGPERWDVMYRAAWQSATESEPGRTSGTPELRALRKLEREVLAAVQALAALEPDTTDRGTALAWRRPEHPVVELAAPLLAERLAATPWALLTPEASACWDGAKLRIGPGLVLPADPVAKELPALWREHAAAHFPTLAGKPASRTPRETSAEDFIPSEPTLTALRRAAAGCTGCPLHRNATQVVFGEGPRRSRAMLVGEQPGDEEDRQGQPFVGPSGRLLDQLLEEAGIPRKKVYVTNAVKHFKFTLSGKRRIHANPTQREVDACVPWLAAEIDALAPDVIVCLGATAAAAVLGPDFRITADRGRVSATPWAPWTMATWHPSAVLRMPDRDARERARREMLDDLRKVAEQLAGDD